MTHGQRLLKNAERRAANYEEQIRLSETQLKNIQDTLKGIEVFHNLSWSRRVWCTLRKRTPLDLHKVWYVTTRTYMEEMTKL